MKNEIQKIIVNALIMEDMENELSNEINQETKLFGDGGFLDSIGLVRLIVMVEDSIASIFNKQVVLANDKAFSMRSSPFSTVGSFVDFVESELAECDNAA